jgi:hypothetical protein
MPQPIHITFDPSVFDLEQLDAVLQALQPLIDQLENAYYQALREHQQQSLPGFPEPPPNDPPFNDPLPF